MDTTMDPKAQHEAFKLQWAAEGSPGFFYDWLMDRVEARLKINRQNESRDEKRRRYQRNKNY